jgi:hypothetical protein
MPNKEESKERKRMVVEEVEATESPKKEELVKPDILNEGAKVSSEELVKEEKPIEMETREIIPEPEGNKKPISAVFWIIIPGIFLLGAILGGIVFYQRGVNKGQAEVVPTPTPSVSTIPSASPSATIDLTKYTIGIFNGSGISGEAGRAKTLLTAAGFKIGTTGNAATYDFTKTIIKAKTTVDSAYLSQLSAALGKSYVVDANQVLATSSASDVQVVVGSSKAQ